MTWGQGQDRVNHLRQVAWRDLLFVHARLVRTMDDALAARGLLGMDVYDVLLTLKSSPDRKLRLSELAERVVLSRSGLTRLVDRIETAGYLRREPVPEDRRGSYAVLTPAGDAALKKTWNVYEGLIIEHFGRYISGEEARLLHEIFSRMIPDDPGATKIPLTIRGVRRGR